MRLKRNNRTNNQDLNNLNNSGRGNPFTTPPGYFDNMSKDIMKTVGTVSILALFRLKSIQIAISVITTMVVATAVYFFTTSDSNSKNQNNPQEHSRVMPRVIIENQSDFPISVVPSESPDKQATVVINPDASPSDILRWLKMLPVDNELIDYLTSDYKNQLSQRSVAILDSDTIENNNSEEDIIDVVGPVFNYNNSHSSETPRVLSAFEMLPRDTCSEQSMTLRAYFPGVNSYQWNTGEVTPEIVADKSGSYRVTLALDNGKKLSKTVSVKIIPKPSLNNDYLITACTGSILRLSVGQKNSGYQYYWPQYKLSTPQLTVSKPGLYYANVTGCQTYVDSFFVVFTHCELGIPNMITPNGDGISETFMITNLSKYPNTELNIFDKSNKLIYKSLNYQNDWDASTVADGSYFYILKFTDGTTQEGLLTVKH